MVVTRNAQLVMDYRSSLRFRSLRLLRSIMDYITSFVFGLLCGQKQLLPPIKDEILLLSATQLADKIRKKQLKSVEVLSAYIARIKDVQPIINAVAETRFDAALEEARQVDELIASGKKSEEELKKSSPLLGVPFTVKDHICVNGMRCTDGLMFKKDHIAKEDADAVKVLKEAGAIPIATTNLPELAASMDCVNKIYGRTRNPYDTRRTCGGSSGGEGALIAAAGSVFGVGTDYAGSIRIPSSLNGIFGHKSSSGVVSHAGAAKGFLHERLFKYNVVGPMCRYGEDLPLVMKILSENNTLLKLDDPVDFKKLKIYYAEDIGDCPLASPVNPAVQKAMKMALNHFKDQYGVEPVQVDLEGLGDSVHHWVNTVVPEGTPRTSAALAEFKYRKNIPAELVKWCFGYSDHMFATLALAFIGDVSVRSHETHKKQLWKLERLRSQFNDILKDNCVFICPTQPEPAPYHSEYISKPYNLSYTAVFNVLLYPATHIPIPSCAGLPVGVQCIANVHNDRLTIAVAEELGRALGGWYPPSPVSTSQ